MSERDIEKLHIKTNWNKLIQEKKLAEVLTIYFRKYHDGIVVRVEEPVFKDVNAVFDGGLPFIK